MQPVRKRATWSPSLPCCYARALEVPQVVEARDEQRSNADVALAAACAGGEATSLRAFEQRFTPVLNAVASRAGLRGCDLEDAVQALRTELLVGTRGGEPLLVRYSGSGSLDAWLRVVAARFFRRQARRAARSDCEHGRAWPQTEASPELELLRARFGELFERAVASAVEQLDERARAVLALSVVSGLSPAQVGEVYGVHRTTASRWQVEARAQILRGVQREIAASTSIAPSEVTLIGRLLQSQLHISLLRYLQPPS